MDYSEYVSLQESTEGGTQTHPRVIISASTVSYSRHVSSHISSSQLHLTCVAHGHRPRIVYDRTTNSLDHRTVLPSIGDPWY